MDHATEYTPQENRKFGVTVGIAFIALAGLLWWRGKLTGVAIAGGAGTLLLVSGLLVPGFLGPVHRGWMWVAHLISKVTTPVFMGLVYYLSIFPIGLVMRVLGKNPIAPREEDSSFWVDRRATGALRSDLERQF